MAILNEPIFFLQIACVGLGSIIALYLGYGALTAYTALLGVLSNLLVCKEVVLFGFTVTASDSIAVGFILALNLIQEWYGKQAARKTIFVNFFIFLSYLVLTQIHNWHVPAPTDVFHEHYALIFSLMPRLALASITTYLVVQFTDSILYGWLSKLFCGRMFAVRSIFSLCFSELLDTVLFSFLGLYGSVSNISDIIIFSYIVKLISISCFIPLIALVKRLIPHDTKNI